MENINYHWINKESNVVFCCFCKDLIQDNEILIRKKNKCYHDECYQRLTDQYREIDFDNR